MKPNPITKSNFQTISPNESRDSLKTKNLDNPFSFQDFTVPQPMTHQDVQPPSYIWDRIATVLDEQDRVKALSQMDSRLTPVTDETEDDRKFIWYAAAVMLVGVIVIQFI
jgi:hypothetical protein